MTTELPAEVVEVAAASLCDWDQQYTWGSLGAESPMKASYEEAARDALTAAAPFIRAQAWDEGYDEGYGDCWDFQQSAGQIGRDTNPYRATTIEGKSE